MSEYCAKSHMILKRNSPAGVEYKNIPLFCKSWDCPECAKAKWSQLRQRIENTFDGDVYLLTLTYAQAGKTLDDVWSILGSTWNRLLSYIRTVRGKKIKYIRVVEPHASDFPHLHIILEKPIDFISDLSLLESQGFGSIAHQKVIPLSAGISYLAKYLTKGHWSPTASKYRKKYHVRVFSSSRLLQLIKPDGIKWEVASSRAKPVLNAMHYSEIFTQEHEKGNKLLSLSLNYGVLSTVYGKCDTVKEIDFSVLSTLQVQQLHSEIWKLYNQDRDNDYNQYMFIQYCETFNKIKTFDLNLTKEYYINDST